MKYLVEIQTSQTREDLEAAIAYFALDINASIKLVKVKK